MSVLRVLFLGHGDSNSRNIPMLVKDISNVGEVSCGSSHTIALSKDGRTVWSFGGGDNGESYVSPGVCICYTLQL